MRQSSLDRLGFGIVGGILSIIIGIYLFAGALAIYDDRSVMSVFEMTRANPYLLIDKFLTGSILFNVVVFSFFLRKKWYQFAKGILICILVIVPIIIYYNW
jgi:hypothetical protein